MKSSVTARERSKDKDYVPLLKVHMHKYESPPVWKLMLCYNGIPLPHSYYTPSIVVDKRSLKKKSSSLSQLFRLVQKDSYGYLSAGTLAMSLTSMTNLLFPKIMGKTIDVASGTEVLPEQMSHTVFVLSILGIFCTGATASFVRVYCLGKVSGNIARALRQQLYAKLLLNETTSKTTTLENVGELTSRFTSDCQIVADSVVDIFASTFRSCNSAIGGSILLFRLSGSLTALSLSFIPLIGMSIMTLSRRGRKMAQLHHDRIAEMAGIVQERLSKLSTVKMFAQEHQELVIFDQHLAGSQDIWNRVKCYDGVKMASISLATNASLFTVLHFGGSLVKRGHLTMGTLTSFALYSGFMALGFSGLASCVGNAKKVVNSSHTLFELLDDDAEPPVKHVLLLSRLRVIKPKEEDMESESHYAQPRKLKGRIELQNIGFRYPTRDQVSVLSNFSLSIQPGQVIGLIGASGSGKSTLVKLLCRLHDADHGSILMDGHDIRRFPVSWLRAQIGVVDQEPQLFSRSIADNIRYGKPEASDAQVIQAATEAQAHEFIMALPDQYQTMVGGPRDDQISGGQKQRLAIARALVKNPSILILDEATSSLDRTSECAVKVALDHAMKGRTVLIIAHRFTTLEKAQDIVVLKDGHVCRRLSYPELVTDKNFCL